MTQTASRLLTGLAAALLVGCSVPGMPHVGGGPLPLYVLAVTSVDPETGNTAHKAVLNWSTAVNAKTYEVQRKFGDNPVKVLDPVQTTTYTDTTVGAGQSFTYTVRALSGDTRELTTSDPKTVQVLPAQVAKPTGLQPADNATVGVGEVPTFSWQPVEGANWYYVKVVNLASGETAYSGLTKNTSLKFGADSPLKFERFEEQFPVGAKSSITRGIVYSWSVSAIRGNVPELKDVGAVDVNPSAAQKFSQG